MDWGSTKATVGAWTMDVSGGAGSIDVEDHAQAAEEHQQHKADRSRVLLSVQNLLFEVVVQHAHTLERRWTFMPYFKTTGVVLRGGITTPARYQRRAWSPERGPNAHGPHDAPSCAGLKDGEGATKQRSCCHRDAARPLTTSRARRTAIARPNITRNATDHTRGFPAGIEVALHSERSDAPYLKRCSEGWGPQGGAPPEVRPPASRAGAVLQAKRWPQISSSSRMPSPSSSASSMLSVPSLSWSN